MQYPRSSVKNLILVIISAADEFRGVPLFHQTIPEPIFPNMRFWGDSNILPVEDPGAKLMILENGIFRNDCSAGNLPGPHKKFARRWKMKSVGAALDFAIEFLPAFSKVISPMAFALFLRIGSPGEHGIFTVQTGYFAVQGKVRLAWHFLQ